MSDQFLSGVFFGIALGVLLAAFYSIVNGKLLIKTTNETHLGFTAVQVMERALSDSDVFDGIEMMRVWFDSIEPGSDTEKEFLEWMLEGRFTPGKEKRL